MSEFDKLRALLDPPEDSGPAGPRPAPKAASQEPEALRQPAVARRRWLWPLVILLVIVAIDAAYLLIKALIAVPL